MNPQPFEVTAFEQGLLSLCEQLELGDALARDGAADDIAANLERVHTYHLQISPNVLRQVVTLVLDATSHEVDADVLNSLLSALYYGVGLLGSGETLDLSNLLARWDAIGAETKAFLLLVVGNTGHTVYLPIIRESLKSESEQVRDAANEALDAIEKRSKKE